MSEKTAIEWCDMTFNPWIGCTKVSPGCANCYAEVLMDTRLGRVGWGPDGTRSLTCKTTWNQPLVWNRKAMGAARRPRVFCASAADLFEEWGGPMHDHHGELVDGNMETWRRRMFALMMVTPHLDWLLLSKRPEHARRWFAEVTPNDIWEAGQDWERECQPAGVNRRLATKVAATLRIGECKGFEVFKQPHQWPLPNLAIGTTIEGPDQESRMNELLDIPAAKRFLSYEPMLGEVDILGTCQKILNVARDRQIICSKPVRILSREMTSEVLNYVLHWVICGGESGIEARPMHPEWARNLRDQCKAAGIPFFFKQWGRWAPCRHDGYHSDPHWIFVEKDGSTHRPGNGYDGSGAMMCRCKGCVTAAGRLLDGVEHSEFPGEGVLIP